MAINAADWEDVPAPAAPGRGIDPGEWEDAPEAPEKPAPSWFEAAARAVAQGATFGFADELAGGAESVLTGKPYKQARDESRQNFKAAEEAHPITSTVGRVAGGVASSLIPVGALAKGAGLATGAILKGTGAAANIVRGAGAGALSGVGESEKEGAGALAIDALKGGAAGGVIGGVAGKLLQGKVRGAQGRVDERLMGDIGYRANKTVRDKMAEMQKGGGVLSTARRHGLDKVAKDPAALAERATEARQVVGRSIGEAYEAADQVFLGVPTKDVVKALRAVKTDVGKNPANGALEKQVGSLIKNVQTKWGGERHVPLARVNDLVTTLENQGFASATLTPAAGAKLKRNVAGAVEKVLQGRMAEIAQSAKNVRMAPSIAARPGFEASEDSRHLLARLPQLNKEYRALTLIKRSADERARLTPFPANGIRQIAGSGLETGALIGSLASGSVLPYLGVKVGLPAAAAANRAADVALAKLVGAAQRGQVTAQAIQRAIEAGVPRGLVERVAKTTVAAGDAEATEEE